MLFSNPTDELRMMNGINATEKVSIKQTPEDKLYRINKEGYYSLDGNFVEINFGEDLEKALQEKVWINRFWRMLELLKCVM